MIQKNNRGEILEAAYWLFYEKGYNATSLDDIAKGCNVTKQAVTYHFGSKGGLGREVSSLIAERNFKNFVNLVEKSIGKKSPELLNAAHLIWFSQVYKNDEKAFRFFREFILIDENFRDLVQVVQPAYEQGVASRSMNPVDAVKQMQMLSAFYSGKGLLYHYAIGNLSCSETLFEQYYFSNYYQMFYSDEELHRLFKEGKEILNQVGLEKLPYRLDLFM